MSDLNIQPMLGRLEQVDVRKYWKHEAYDFTPWLAQAENLEMLGDTLSIELELIAMEKAVGPYSADILCKNLLTDERVVIENQLEKTDHWHMGQVITYAAGLQATAVIWIAREFTDEHRAALDWLNEHTNEKMRFWGVTVELWRIADSAWAPKFNIVSRPNEWVNAVTDVGGNTPSQELRYKYWTAFRDIVEASPSLLKPPAPSKSNWVAFSIGKVGVQLNPVISATKQWMRIEIYLAGNHARNRFHQFIKHKSNIEQITGQLYWQEIIGKQDARISLSQFDTEISNEADWQRQHEWLRETAKKFHTAFAPLVKQLNDSVNFIPTNETNDQEPLQIQTTLN